jgi:hypothetical protein
VAPEEEILSVLPVDEPLAAPPAEDSSDQLEAVEAVPEPAPPRRKARAARAAGLLKRDKFLVEGLSGGFHAKADYDLFDLTTDEWVGSGQEKGAAQALSLLNSRAAFAAVVEVFDGNDDLLFTMERPGRFLGQRPKVDVWDAQGREVGSVQGASLLRLDLELYDRDGELLAEAQPEGKPRKWVFWTEDDRRLGRVTVETMRRPGALLTPAQGGIYSVTVAPDLAGRPDVKILLLATAMFIDLLALDTLNRPIRHR